MKLLKLTALSFVLASSLAASPKNAMADDMRSMLHAMNDIQTAGFYSNKEGMQEGVKKLKEGLHSLLATDAKAYLPDDKAYANKFAKKRASMITLYADDLLNSLKQNDLEEALENYAFILKQCTSCHIRLRSY